MSIIDNKLNEILDIEPVVITEKVIVPAIKQAPEKTDLENDMDNTRRTLNMLIEKGMASLDEVAHVARETENPYAYMVTATMIKTLAETTRELLDAQSKLKEIKGIPDQPAVTVEKAVFVGSPKELLTAMKKANESI